MVEWMTPEEVAVELRLFTKDGDPNTRLVQLLAQRGELPGEKVAKYWRFRRELMNKFKGRAGQPPKPRDAEEASFAEAGKRKARQHARRERRSA